MGKIDIQQLIVSISSMIAHLKTGYSWWQLEQRRAARAFCESLPQLG